MKNIIKKIGIKNLFMENSQRSDVGIILMMVNWGIIKRINGITTHINKLGITRGHHQLGAIVANDQPT